MRLLLIVLLFLPAKNSPQNEKDFCRLIKDLIIYEKLNFVSPLEDPYLGRVYTVVFFTENIKNNFGTGIGEYSCGKDRILVFGEVELFSYTFDRCIRIDKIRRKGKNTMIKYSLLKYNVHNSDIPFELIKKSKVILDNTYF